MRTILRAGVLLLVLVPALSAQNRQELGPAYELERRGRYAEAAAEYRRVLEHDPSQVLALFGLERVLQAQDSLRAILPFLDSTIARVPGDATVRGLQLRVLGTLGEREALTAAAEQWIASDPAASTPWREWAFALAQQGDIREARAVLERGRARLGGASLVQELAQIAVIANDWPAATGYWHAAAVADAALDAAAGMSLAQAPPPARDGILLQLQRSLDDPVARRIAADLLVVWNRPGEAWALLDANLPDDDTHAAAILRRFADRARVAATREHQRVRGFALERVADLVGGAEAQQARIEAARAFADAGERGAAERMLEQIARDPAVAPQAALAAMAALIAVEADGGQVDRAERRLAEWRDRLPAEDVSGLRERIAWGWIRRAQLNRADGALAADSGLAVQAVRGWVALYRGDLPGAVAWFREAGPYSGTRADATDRTEMLALMQQIEPDTVPALGRALLRLAAGDTAGAAGDLVDAAGRLPATGGRAAVLLFAAGITEPRSAQRAEALYAAAAEADPAGPVVPAASFALARLAWAGGRSAEAVARLEQLILDHPQSAVVPQARRLLDQVRGVVPRS